MEFVFLTCMKCAGRVNKACSDDGIYSLGRAGISLSTLSSILSKEKYTWRDMTINLQVACRRHGFHLCMTLVPYNVQCKPHSLCVTPKRKVRFAMCVPTGAFFVWFMLPGRGQAEDDDSAGARTLSSYIRPHASHIAMYMQLALRNYPTVEVGWPLVRRWTRMRHTIGSMVMHRRSAIHIGLSSGHSSRGDGASELGG